MTARQPDLDRMRRLESPRPRVSIVTPTYNRADLLPETISSVVGQNFSDFEHLIIDDGSTDATRDVVEDFGDSRVFYYWHENQGESASTNRGWELARGDYVAVLSSDDPVLPGWLEHLVRFMDENPEIVVAYPDWQIIDEFSRVVTKVETFDYSLRAMVAWVHPFPGPGALIRHSAARDMPRLRNPAYRYAPDLDSWWQLGIRGPFARLPKVLAQWRNHEGSITVADKSLARGREMVRIVRNFFAQSDLPAELRPLERFALSRAHSMAAYVLREADPLRSMIYLRRSYAISRKDAPRLPAWFIRPPEPSRTEILAEMQRRRIERRGRTGAQGAGESASAEQNVAWPPKIWDAWTPEPQKPVPQERFDVLWPLFKADLAEMQDLVSQFTPTSEVRSRLTRTVTLAAPPAIGQTIRAVLDQIPASVDHLLVVPWIGVKGGSETVMARLIEALVRHYRAGGVCLLGPDPAFDTGSAGSVPIPVASFNAVDPGLSIDARQELFDRIMIQRRPPVVHCINSYVGWNMYKSEAGRYARDSRLYTNIYSDIRVGDGVPAALYFYEHLPACIDHLAGIFADNETVVRKAERFFGLTPRICDRFHVVRTPVIGGSGDLRAFTPVSTPRSLWMSRIAAEKRLDVLAAIARRCPDRTFALYGTKGLGIVDTSEIEAIPTIEMRGAFGSLADIPAHEFDSYVFTSSGEGMPIALLEVAALGLPVVAPDVGGISEFVDEATGWLVSDPGSVDGYVEALSCIQADPSEAARRVANAQERLLRFYTTEAFQSSIGRIPGYLGGYGR